MKVGQIVQVPADRGDLPYTGVIQWVEEQVCTNHLGVPYRWLHIRRLGGTRKAVWPSNRLGFKIEMPVSNKH